MTKYPALRVLVQGAPTVGLSPACQTPARKGTYHFRVQSMPLSLARS